MNNFDKTVGFITGGASGIGLGVARALGQQGMTLILADIEPETLARAAQGLRSEGMQVHTTVLDVSDADAYSKVAQQTLAEHGKVNFLFNNAGVAGGHFQAGSAPLQDWRWLVDVNLMGVVHGVEYFLPAMRESGEPGYIINTASMAGHMANAGMGAYTATKFAVVGYSEVLRQELGSSNIDVSVLCPAWVKTRIAESQRNFPGGQIHSEGQEGVEEIGRLIAQEGISTEALAKRVLEGMALRTFYLFTHPDFWPLLERRLNRVAADYQAVIPG